MKTRHAQTFKAIVTLAAASALLTACGGGGGESAPVSNVPPPAPGPAAVQVGKFKDSNVAGLAFVSGAEAGITNAGGEFSCETGEPVTFSVGSVIVGQADCATLITPTQAAVDDADFDLQLANIARFLQMLDVNGDVEDGIAISEEVQQVAEGWPPVDFRTTDLQDELVTIISDAASVDGVPHTLPAAQDAVAHLEETLACAFAGAYSGSISGTNSGAAGMVIGAGGNSGFAPFGYEWQGIDAVNEFAVFGGGTGIFGFSIRVLPEIDNTNDNVAGPLAVQFVNPDRIEGTWEGGNLTLNRIGGDNGFAYRFVGRASGSDTAAYLSLNTDGVVFEGEAFDIVTGTTFQVTGELDGTAATFNATGGGSSFTGTGTLSLLADGSPYIEGSLSDGSTISMNGCRLNRGGDGMAESQ
ncbi:MAG: hypothetical protein AAGM16_15835 [Pseudomonadota bacterium]